LLKSFSKDTGAVAAGRFAAAEAAGLVRLVGWPKGRVAGRVVGRVNGEALAGGTGTR
jgi:hypothetical protein